MTTLSVPSADASSRKSVSLSPGSVSGGFGPTKDEVRMGRVRKYLLQRELPLTEAIGWIVRLENEIATLRSRSNSES